MAKVEDFETLRKTADILRRSNNIASWKQLSIRLRLSEDDVVRAIKRLEAYFRSPLVVKQADRRLALSGPGERIARIVEQLDRAAHSESDDAETLAIDADMTLAGSVLPFALPDFFSVFGGGLVALRVGRLDPDPAVLQGRLANGTISFALGFSDDDPPASAEVLEPPFPWVALLPANHPLGSVPDGLAPESLAREDRVFVPDERSIAARSGALHAVPPSRRIECESVAVVRAMVAGGLGVGLALDFSRVSTGRPDGLRCVPLVGVEPERIAVFLPRKTGALSEAAQSLITAIKRVVTAPPEPPREPAPVAAEPADVAPVTA